MRLPDKDVNDHQVLWSMLLADGRINFAMLINPGKRGRQISMLLQSREITKPESTTPPHNSTLRYNRPMTPRLLGAPLGVYIHIPFCQHICPYCDFTTYAGQEPLIPRYVDALETAIRRAGERLDHRAVETMFFGGGNALAD